VAQKDSGVAGSTWRLEWDPKSNLPRTHPVKRVKISC